MAILKLSGLPSMLVVVPCPKTRPFIINITLCTSCFVNGPQSVFVSGKWLSTPSDFEPPTPPKSWSHPPPPPKKCQSEAPSSPNVYDNWPSPMSRTTPGGGPKKMSVWGTPPQMSMTIDLPQCQEQRRGGGGGAQKNVSLRHLPQISMTIDLPQCQEQRRGEGPKKCQSEAPHPKCLWQLTFPNVKNNAGGGGGQKNVSLRHLPQISMTIDLPECQERRRGKHKGTKKVSVFFEGVAGLWPATTQKRRKAAPPNKRDHPSSPVWWCSLPSLLLGRATLSPVFCWVVLLGLSSLALFSSPFTWCCLVYSLFGWSLLYGGAAFHPLQWVVVRFPPSSVGWCCLVSSFLGVVSFSPFTWCCLDSSIFGWSLLLGGAAFHPLHWVGLLFPVSSAWFLPSLGGIAVLFLLFGGFFLPPPLLGGAALSPPYSVGWCCLVSSSSFWWCCCFSFSYWVVLLGILLPWRCWRCFPLLLRGAAWFLPSLGGLSCLVALSSISSIG